MCSSDLVGLSHQQVVNIYTTYFESTKTGSNDFVGALGLGSKSPFSYTENFGVTAVQNGHMGVYTAFINEQGVPSIALMTQSATDQPNGVEVKFSVNNRADFEKFRTEAEVVYQWFAYPPTVTGATVAIQPPRYERENIIPGVHVGKGDYYSITSYAVMGNIAYPIAVPNANANLGRLAGLLSYGLIMHFDIGELDFQASREGLSYIPSTIEAIKRKLIALNAQLAVHLALEADAIKNEWERAYFLMDKTRETLWGEAARAYIAAKPSVLIDDQSGHYVRTKEQTIDVKDLAARYNINILAFYKSRHNATCNDVRPSKRYKDKMHTDWDEVWNFGVERSTVFVVNDTKKGALARAKYHWRNATSKGVELPSHGPHHVYVLSAATAGYAMDLDGFFAELHNPPVTQRLLVSGLIEKERKVKDKTKAENVRILRLERSDDYRRRSEVVWKEAGQASEYDSKKTYYYVPLSGYAPVGVKTDPHTLYERIKRCGVDSIKDLSIYGVRKSDIAWVQTQKNWVPIEQFVADVLGKLTPTALASLAAVEVDNGKIFGYNKDIAPLVSATSPYRVLVEKLKGVAKSSSFSSSDLTYLLKQYAPGVDYLVVAEQLKAEMAAVRNRYPLLSSIRDWDINNSAVAEYINLIDTSKGI